MYMWTDFHIFEEENPKERPEIQLSCEKTNHSNPLKSRQASVRKENIDH